MNEIENRTLSDFKDKLYLEISFYKLMVVKEKFLCLSLIIFTASFIFSVTYFQNNEKLQVGIALPILAFIFLISLIIRKRITFQFKLRSFSNDFILVLQKKKLKILLKQMGFYDKKLLEKLDSQIKILKENQIDPFVGASALISGFTNLSTILFGYLLRYEFHS